MSEFVCGLICLIAGLFYCSKGDYISGIFGVCVAVYAFYSGVSGLKK